jgi:hypothetical protein
MVIYCCYKCEKRNPGCHSTCEDYKADKAEYDKRKAEYDRERQITGAIQGARRDKVYNAMKGRR